MARRATTPRPHLFHFISYSVFFFFFTLLFRRSILLTALPLCENPVSLMRGSIHLSMPCRFFYYLHYLNWQFGQQRHLHSKRSIISHLQPWRDTRLNRVIMVTTVNSNVRLTSGAWQGCFGTSQCQQSALFQVQGGQVAGDSGGPHTLLPHQICIFVQI